MPEENSNDKWVTFSSNIQGAKLICVFTDTVSS